MKYENGAQLLRNSAFKLHIQHCCFAKDIKKQFWYKEKGIANKINVRLW